MTDAGTVDRIVAGLLLIAFAIPIGFSATGWKWIGRIGIAPLLTALIGYCPACTLFGVSTCPIRERT